jgi:hypothetical protein
MKKILLLALALTATAAHADAGEALREKIGTKRLSLALSMVKAFDLKLVCETDAYPTDINREVKTARYQVSESLLKKFIAKTSQSRMNEDLAFREATGQSQLLFGENTEASITKALLGTRFFRPAMGAYGSPYNVYLQAGGVAQEKHMEVLDEEPWFQWHDSETTWALVKKDGVLTGHYLQIGKNLFKLSVDDGTEFRLIPAENANDEMDFQSGLQSNDSLCDA